MLGLVQAIHKLPKDKTLGPTLRQLASRDASAASNEHLLSAARDARNYIAHEGARFDIHSVQMESLCEGLDKLRGNVRDLAVGDNLVSTWIYQIDEHDNAYCPRDLIAAYPGMVDDWVFGPVSDLLAEDSSND